MAFNTRSILGLNLVFHRTLPVLPLRQFRTLLPQPLLVVQERGILMMILLLLAQRAPEHVEKQSLLPMRVICACEREVECRFWPTRVLQKRLRSYSELKVERRG